MTAVDGQIDIAGNVYEAPMPVQKVKVQGTFDEAAQTGGKAPQTGSLSVTGMKAEVEGAFEKGELLYGRFVARVVEVSQKDSLDSETGIVTEAVQQHKAVVLDFVLTEKEEM